jgi:hypothetical protein
MINDGPLLSLARKRRLSIRWITERRGLIWCAFIWCGDVLMASCTYADSEQEAFDKAVEQFSSAR